MLPWMLAIRIDRTAEEEIVVTNLCFVRRRISRSALGCPRLRLIAHGAVKTRAPRAWIPVQGGLPIYVDPFGTFPDPVAFSVLFQGPAPLGVGHARLEPHPGSRAELLDDPIRVP